MTVHFSGCILTPLSSRCRRIGRFPSGRQPVTVALTLPTPGDERRILRRHDCEPICRFPDCTSIQAHNGSPALLRDEMGLFPLVATRSPIRPSPHPRTARHWWPNLLWRYCAASMPQCMIGDAPLQSAPSRPTFFRPQSQSRANPRQSDHRASQRIQRAPLSRRRSRTASTLRRWMPPTVERGPPATRVIPIDVSKDFSQLSRMQ